MPSVDMHTSSRSLKSVHIPSPVSSASSQSTSLENTSHRVPVQVFEGHKRRVTCVCFYPDEGKLVSGSADRTLRIWDRETGAVKVLGGHTDWVREVDVSRDGKMVVSGSDDKTVRIWEEGSKDATHVLQGHNNSVYSVAFSPDSSRVVSGSSDDTMRVWLIGTGKPAFEPSKCHGHVNCVRYSPSGDKIASGAHSVQIWDAETGLGILLIKNSFVSSLAWTVDGTQVIGGGHRKVTIWNSYNGEHLYNWNAAHMYSNMTLITLSLSPAGTRLATCGHLEKTAFVSDVSSGKQVDALEHDRNIGGIIYSPSGQFIATACNDTKIRLWVAPTDNPAITSRASSFSSFLDLPAIPLTEPSRNDRMALNQFWDNPPSHQQTSPLPQRVFNKVKGMLTSLFARRPADVAQPVTPSSQLRLDHLTQLHIPQSPVRETVEQVEVAGGRDKTFWIVLERIVWTPVNTIIFMIFYCRKPGPRERGGFLPTNRDTRANSSRAPAGNAAATSSQSEPPKTVDGADNAGARPDAPPTPASKPVIRSQPKPTVGMTLSGTENPGAEPDSSATAVGNSQICNQSDSIEMVTIREISTVSAHASPQRIPSTDLSARAVTSPEPSSSTATAAAAPLSTVSNSPNPAFEQPSSLHLEIQSGNTFSAEEIAIIKDFRRRKMLESIV